MAIHSALASYIRRRPNVWPIHTEADYDCAVEIVNKLAVRPEGCLAPAEQDRLDIFTELIATYDTKHYACDLSHLRGLRMLKSLMTEAGMSASDLGRLLGDRSIGSRILNGKRKLNLRHIRILAEHFHVTPDVLMPAR